MLNDKVLDKYKLMVDEYLINGFNGRQAYKKFNPEASDRTAEVNFSLILSKAEVSDYLDAKKRDISRDIGTSHRAILDELTRWAYSDITNVITLTPEEVKELPPGIRRLITAFETKTRILTDGTRIVTVKCTFVSKEKAMEMIHKHIGFYAEDNYQKNVELSGAQRKELLAKIEERRQRLDQREIDSLM